MAGRGALEMVEITARVPRGQEGFWVLIRELDEAGPWGVPAVDRQSNVNAGTIRDYVRRLVAGGYAEVVAVRPPRRHAPAGRLYRLVKRPVEAPRLTREGREMPEPATATLWRTMKMLRTFTARELAAVASEERKVSLQSTKRYVGHLHVSGILAIIAGGGPRHAATYRLVRNLGARPPQVLRTHAVFDPNSRSIIGEAQAEVVQ